MTRWGRVKRRTMMIVTSPGVAGLSAIMIPVLMAYGVTH